jgi:hypothetical protein
MKKQLLITALLSFQILAAFSQKATAVSPNQKIHVAIYNQQNTEVGEWYLKVTYFNNGKK